MANLLGIVWKKIKENPLPAVGGAVAAVGVSIAALSGTSKKDEKAVAKPAETLPTASSVDILREEDPQTKVMRAIQGYEERSCVTFEDGHDPAIRFQTCYDPVPADAAKERECKPMDLPADINHLFLMSIAEDEAINPKKLERYKEMYHGLGPVLIKQGNRYSVYGNKGGAWQVMKLDGVDMPELLVNVFPNAGVGPKHLKGEDIPRGIATKIAATGISGSATISMALFNAEQDEKQPLPYGPDHVHINVDGPSTVKQGNQHVDAKHTVQIHVDKTKRKFAWDSGSGYVTADADRKVDPKQRQRMYSNCAPPKKQFPHGTSRKPEEYDAQYRFSKYSICGHPKRTSYLFVESDQVDGMLAQNRSFRSVKTKQLERADQQRRNARAPYNPPQNKH